MFFPGLSIAKWVIPTVFLVGMAAAALALFHYQSNKIDSLLVENSVLSEQVARNQGVVRRLYSRIAEQSSLNNKLDMKMKESELLREELSNKFREHKLKDLAEAKPEWIERIINNGTSEVFRDIESITTP